MTRDRDSAVIEVSRRIYESTLVLYPKDLRKEFGAEMVEVFEAQVSEAFEQKGIPGVLRVWLRTAREFLGIAVIGQMIVPAFAIATAFLLMLWLAGFMATPVAVDKTCGH